MRKRCAVQPAPCGDTVFPKHPAEYFGVNALVPHGKHARLRPVRAVYGQTLDLGKTVRHYAAQHGLIAAYSFLAHTFDVTDALTKSGDARNVVGPGFESVGQIVRHFFVYAVRAGAAAKQRTPHIAAKQHPGTLRSEQPRVP